MSENRHESMIEVVNPKNADCLEISQSRPVADSISLGCVMEMPVGVPLSPRTQSSACGTSTLRFRVQLYHEGTQTHRIEPDASREFER